MPIYCNRELMSGLDGAMFPASKEQLLRYAEGRDVPEASIVALNELPDGVLFVDAGSVCSNVGVVCSLEVYRKLAGFQFPGKKDALVRFAEKNGASRLALNSLEELDASHNYQGIREVCSASGLEE
jgi:hypothetical protein